MRVRAVRAHPGNVYVCNETHAVALDAVQRHVLSDAYCLYIPTAATSDMLGLADAVSGVVSALVNSTGA